jgi:hypothetical protein
VAFTVGLTDWNGRLVVTINAAALIGRDASLCHVLRDSEVSCDSVTRSFHSTRRVSVGSVGYCEGLPWGWVVPEDPVSVQHAERLESGFFAGELFSPSMLSSGR